MKNPHFDAVALDYSHSTLDVALDPKGPGRGISLRGDCVICGKRSRRRSDFANPLFHDSLFSNIALHLTLLTSQVSRRAFGSWLITPT